MGTVNGNNSQSRIIRSSEVVSAANEVVPVLREFAGQAEEDSRLPKASAAALTDSGMFRLGVPRSFAGYQAGVRACLEVTAALAHGCVSSSWITVVSYGAQQMAASFGDAVRGELWAETPDVPMCGAFSPAGATVTAADGGLVVSGRWSWCSGAHQARWAVLGVPAVDETGPWLVLVPRSELAIEDTWDMAGMRGTGSDTLVADDVFVPDYRVRPFAEVVAGARPPAEPLYRIPGGALTITLMGPLLGAAEEIFDLTMETVAKGKPIAQTFYRNLADSPSYQGSLADAANLIDSARLHLFRSADYLDTAVVGGADINDPVARARVRMDTGYAARCLREAAGLLMDVSGAGSFARSNPLQRLWRDLETASRHPTLSTGITREVYGRALVHAPQQVSPLI
jgi:3-hydroxy-9,10-secoandrosta-1,3,5(10)-triene-9,17-dione monooxygenase